MSKIETSVSDIRQEITDYFGYFPQVFVPALRNPALLGALWQETKAKYKNNRLPALHKELLFAYLSRECGNPYCVIVHSLKLRELGMTGEQIRDLFKGLGRLGVDEEIKELLRLSLKFYKDPASAVTVLLRIKEILGEHYDDWVSLISFIVATHRWVEGHAGEISYAEDQYAMRHLQKLIDEADELKRILRAR